MDSVASDIRHACRALRAQPAWTLAALLCLTIGTGVNAAVFSLVNGVLLRPLPFDEPAQIVMIAFRWDTDRQAGPVSLDRFREIKQASDVFEHLAIRTFLPVGVASGGPARMVQAEFVSGNYFELLRLRPAAGRLLTAEGDRPGAETEAVISEKLWRTRFNSDASIVGKAVRVNGKPVLIRGVAPAGFVGAMRIIAADMWLPASSYPAFASPESPREAEARREFGVIGRLKHGVSLAQTRQRLDAALGNQWRSRKGTGSAPSSLIEEATGFGVPPALRPIVAAGSALLFGLMALLAAVAVANVAGLMLASATGRQKEISIRLALGASRVRIVRQVLTESMILSIAGSCLGALVATALPHLVTGLGPSLPEHLSFAVDVRPDWRNVIYATFSAVGIAMLFGLAPARLAARTDSSLALRESSGNSRGRDTSRTLNAFVVGQVAVSTVLMVTALLLGRTYLNTQAVDPGIDIKNTLAVSIDWRQTGSPPKKAKAFFARLRSEVSTMPGVRYTALTNHPPLSASGVNRTVMDDSSNTFIAGAIGVTPAYFDTVRLALLQGRNFGPLETSSQPVAIINETMARQLSPGSSPLGRMFSVSNGSGPRIEVIGVVKDAKYRSLSERPRAVFYEPLTQYHSGPMTLLVRTATEPGLLTEPIRREIQLNNPDLADITIRTLEEQFEESTVPSRQRALVLSVACATGLLLSAFGLFGVISYGVRQRVRELGVRIAIGAQPADILRMILHQALQLVGTGFAFGLVLAFGATKFIASVLFGVSAHDPITLSLVALLLVGVAAGAAYLPARWAMRIDPIRSIRAE